MVLLAGFLACTAPETADGAASVDSTGDSAVDTGPFVPTTDTFPSFYGQVPKNLLMISMDAFRRDLLTRYGGSGLVPFLDEKLAEGVSLDQHRTCSDWTFPSVLCVQHGATNLDVGYVPDLHDSDTDFAPEIPTLAGRLSDAGWRSMLVTSNSWFSADHGSDYGFDSSERPDDHRAETVAAVGLERVQEALASGTDRWYLHLHVKETHAAYNPPDAYLAGEDELDPIPYDLTDSDSQYTMDDEWPDMTAEEQQLVLEHLLIRYHGEAMWLDDQLRAAFAAFDDAGLLDDTLVVFWSDHGEQFWEHDEQTHAYGLNKEENDAVAFFWAKNIVPGSWDEPTSHIDLAPTVMNLFDVYYGDDVTGLPVGTAPSDRPLDFVAMARLGAVQSVVSDGWKLIYRWQTGEHWLYDLAADPLELDNRYAVDDPHAVALQALLDPKIAALQPLTTRYTPR